jgi:hypothetical protein
MVQHAGNPGVAVDKNLGDFKRAAMDEFGSKKKESGQMTEE